MKMNVFLLYYELFFTYLFIIFILISDILIFWYDKMCSRFRLKRTIKLLIYILLLLIVFIFINNFIIPITKYVISILAIKNIKNSNSIIEFSSEKLNNNNDFPMIIHNTYKSLDSIPDHWKKARNSCL